MELPLSSSCSLGPGLYWALVGLLTRLGSISSVEVTQLETLRAMLLGTMTYYLMSFSFFAFAFCFQLIILQMEFSKVTSH